MPRFTLKKTVHAQRQKTYDMMSGFGSYPQTIPQHFPSVRVRSVRGEVAVVEEHVNLGGRRLVIMARHVSRPPSAHDLFVIGGSLKGTSIMQRFEAAGDDTLVVTDVNLRLGLAMGISSALDRGRYKRDYGAILDDLAAAAEESG